MKTFNEFLNESSKHRRKATMFEFNGIKYKSYDDNIVMQSELEKEYTKASK